MLHLQTAQVLCLTVRMTAAATHLMLSAAIGGLVGQYQAGLALQECNVVVSDICDGFVCSLPSTHCLVSPLCHMECAML